MKSVELRFVEYVKKDTQSDENSASTPSSKSQLEFAQQLCEELKGLGVSEVTCTETGYVYGTIPGNDPEITKTIGLIAHMDTAPAFSGKNVNPRQIQNYDGKDIVLNENGPIIMSPDIFPDLKKHVGKDLLVTDGTTLLGADDKAGIAEIVTMAEYLKEHPEWKHGKIMLGFTPDEEIGCGSDHFDLSLFQADIAYTVDGGGLGSIDYENFNAANAKIVVHGQNIHPGDAKGKMKNALEIAMKFHQLLPAGERPELTEGYEGFYHLDSLSGTVEEARMQYILRDHDREKFEKKKTVFSGAVEYINQLYGKNTLEMELKDSYYNMKDKIAPCMHYVNRAKELMKEIGIQPFSHPIRGGTDGARISYMGIPCPNICTGGANGHGKYEYIPVQDMEKVTQLLIKLVCGQFREP